MLIEPKYSENIIVGIIYKNIWYWCVSERDIWFLDYSKMFGPEGSTYRFGIEVVSEKNAEEFFEKIKQYFVSTEELNNVVASIIEFAEEWDDISEYSPSLFVDFDKKVLLSSFPEPLSFEKYVPDGWLGEYRSFLDYVPVEERYWVINTKCMWDYFDD